MRKFYIEDNEALPAVQYVDTQPEGFSLVTDPLQLERLYCTQYKYRANDGATYFNSFRSKLMLDIIGGTYTELEVFALEGHLKTLAEAIVSGNWLTAQNISTNLAVSGIYSQVMKDEIQLYIDTYITENY